MCRTPHNRSEAGLNSAAVSCPRITNWPPSHSNAHARDARPDLAARDVDAALALTPNDHRLLTRRAQFMLARGDKNGALADASAAAVAVPRGSLDVLPIVTLFERMGMADRGLALIDPVVELHREDSSYGTLLNARAWCRALANVDLDRALKDVNMAIKRSGPLPGILDTRALVAFRRKDFAAAIADETRALSQMPKLPAALFIRGLARSAGGDLPGGQTDITSARKIQPRIDAYYAANGILAPDAAEKRLAPQADNGRSPSKSADGADDNE